MDRLYFDNGATSFPKAPGLGAAVGHYLEDIGTNINRSSYAASTTAALTALETREQLARLFHFGDPSHVIFTSGVTMSLNLVIKGLLRPGDHAIVSSMEHNATMRPLVQLAAQGVTFDRIPGDERGQVDAQAIIPLIRPNTRLIACLHASNVCGTLLPIAEIGRIAQSYGIPFLLDTAQTAGHIDIDFKALGLSALGFTGHKGLLGPQGIGGLLLTPELAQSLTPLIAGGTGSASDSEELPTYMPDRFESGTLNLPGIYGLHHSLCFLENNDWQKMHTIEMEWTRQFLDGVSELPHVRRVGLPGTSGRMAVVSLDFTDRDNAVVAHRLSSEYGIMTRCGLHCAPSAHQTLGTYPQGSVRFSFSAFNTAREIHQAITALDQILKGDSCR